VEKPEYPEQHVKKYNIFFTNFLAHYFFSLWVYTLNFWHVGRLNQLNLPYAIVCDLDLLLQGQIIYNLKKNKS
jgi:hypothetical protein